MKRARFEKGMAAYERGGKAIKEGRYEDALNDYKEFVEMKIDTSMLNTNTSIISQRFENMQKKNKRY
jgi:hypothetical protein